VSASASAARRSIWRQPLRAGAFRGRGAPLMAEAVKRAAAAVEAVLKDVLAKAANE
jgi:hypothetical protein